MLSCFLFFCSQNIPQFVIQVLYVISLEDSNDIELLVIFSLILTLLSLLYAIAMTSVIVTNLLIKYNKHVQIIHKIGVKLTLHCSKFEHKHSFIDEKIEKSILNILRTSDNCNSWMDRSDVSLECELFYINNDRLKVNKEIDCYFQVILALYKDDTDAHGEHGKSSRHLLLNTINQFEYESPLNKRLVHNIESEIGVNKNSLTIKNANIIYQRMINFLENGNGTENIVIALSNHKQSPIHSNSSPKASDNKNNNNYSYNNDKEVINIDLRQNMVTHASGEY